VVTSDLGFMTPHGSFEIFTSYTLHPGQNSLRTSPLVSCPRYALGGDEPGGGGTPPPASADFCASILTMASAVDALALNMNAAVRRAVSMVLVVLVVSVLLL
jgi:hypothetical protein